MAELFIESLATVGELIERLSDGHYVTRAAAAGELVNRRGQAREALPHILALAADPSWFVRLQVTRATVHLDAPVEQAISLLRRLLGDEDEIVRSYAAWALRKFGQEEGLPPVDDSPPELVVFGAIPDIKGEPCQELVVQEFWYDGELADKVSAVWMRFSDRWYRLRFDGIVYWEEEESGPEQGPWPSPSLGEHRLTDLAGPLSLRGVVLDRLTAEPTRGGAVVRFDFRNGVGIEFEDHLDETTYRLHKPAERRE